MTAMRPGAGLRAPVAPARSHAVVNAPVELSSIRTLGSIPTVGQIPAEVDIIAYQGDDIRWTIPVLQDGNPANLVGCTIDSQVRLNAESGDILATLTTTVSSNNVSFWFSSDDTALLTKAGAVWDAQITDTGGFITTFVRGAVIVTEQVTRT